MTLDKCKALATAILAVALLLGPLSPPNAGAQAYAAATTRDGHKDFDFEFGTWRTHYRLLKHRLAGDHEWYDCYGTSIVRPYWKGYGNLEDGDLACPNKYIGGLTLRLYDAATHQWSLWWGTRKLGVVPPQQVGHFDASGVGDFYAHDIQEGKHVIIRFEWTRVNGNPHFAQAFSADDGKTWETNWTTDYEPVAPSTKGVWNAPPTVGDGHNGFDFLLGTWRTHYRRLRHPLAGDREWYSCEGTAVVTPFWSGSGNLEDGDLQCPGKYIAGVTLRVYNATTKQWQLWFGTKTLGLLTPPQIGTFDARGVGEFYCNDTWNGKPIIVRYKWTVRDGHPYFEQAFSPDKGKTWETNWTTVYDRAS